MWGGTRDVGKNETEKGLQHMKNFVENHRQTNFIVMSVPYRYDLDPILCVNGEVKVYNMKLEKYLKVCENARIIAVDSHRDLFTRHGLHMNTRGKEQIARKITQTIKIMLSDKKNDPIIKKDREDQGINSEEIKKIVTDTQNEDENADNSRRASR